MSTVCSFIGLFSKINIIRYLFFRKFIQNFISTSPNNLGKVKSSVTKFNQQAEVQFTNLTIITYEEMPKD